MIIVSGSGSFGEYAPEVARVGLEKHEQEAVSACEAAMKHARAVVKQISYVILCIYFLFPDYSCCVVLNIRPLQSLNCPICERV